MRDPQGLPEAARLLLVLLALALPYLAVARSASAVGEVIWVRQRDFRTLGGLGYSSMDSTPKVVVDGQGNSYLAGTIDANPNPFDEDLDVFVVSYDANGALRWQRQLGRPTAHERGVSIAVTADAVYVVGFGPTLPGVPPATPSSQDVFVARYDHAGNLAWVRMYGSAGNDWAGDIAVLDGTTIGVTGSTDGSFPGSPTPSGGGTDAVLLRIATADGSLASVRQFGSPANDWALAIVAAAPYVVIGGTSGGTLPGAQPDAEGAFVAAYTATGVTPAWVGQQGRVPHVHTPSTGVESLSASQGKLYVAGWTEDNNKDAFVTALDISAGPVLLWSVPFGSPGYDTAMGVANDGAGNVWASGMTNGVLFASPDGNQGYIDAFLIRFDAATGTVVGQVRQLGTEFDDAATGIALDEAGSPSQVGWTQGTLPGSPNVNNTFTPVPFIARYTGALADSDGDGLYDLWETAGIDGDGDGDVDLSLAALGATPDHKDIFIEIDSMSCALNASCASGDVASHELLPGVSDEAGRRLRQRAGLQPRRGQRNPPAHACERGSPRANGHRRSGGDRRASRRRRGSLRRPARKRRGPRRPELRRHPRRPQPRLPLCLPASQARRRRLLGKGVRLRQCL